MATTGFPAPSQSSTPLASNYEVLLRTEIDLQRAREAEEQALHIYKEATAQRINVEREFREIATTVEKLMQHEATQWVPPNERPDRPLNSVGAILAHEHPEGDLATPRGWDPQKGAY